MKKFDAIIFDLDGVLIDSFEIKKQAFQELFDFPVDITKGGKSRREKIKFYLPKIDIYDTDKLLRKYKNLIYNKILNLPLITETSELLKLKNIDFYIVSGAPIDEIVDILYKHNIFNLFSGVYGANIEKHKALKNISSKYENTIFIGDQESDLIESTKAKIPFFGYGPFFGNPKIQEMFKDGE